MRAATGARRGPPADGHGVLLRGHGVDAGRRGRAPAALAGARDLLRLPASCPQDALNGRLRQRLAAVRRSRRRIGQAQGREGRLLDRGRRPVQGVARLRRPARGRVRRRARARPRGPHADRPHAAVRRRRRARSSRCTASAARSPTTTASRSPTSGSRCPTSALWPSTDADGRFRFDRLPPGPAPAASRARATARRPTAELDVPGAVLDLVIGGKAAQRPKAASADDRMGMPRRLPDRLLPHGRPTGEVGAMDHEPAGRASCSGTSGRSCVSACIAC